MRRDGRHTSVIQGASRRFSRDLFGCDLFGGRGPREQGNPPEPAVSAERSATQSA
jgi:hypothetical protein